MSPAWLPRHRGSRPPVRTSRHDGEALFCAPWMPRRGAVLLLCTALLAASPAAAGPLQVQAADGSQWRVNEDDETQLQRFDPNGQPDTRFGRAGKMEYTLGHADAGTAALRVDGEGRIWVAGTSSASGASGPVVMRFLADGQVDSRWGVAGRNSATPPGQRLVVADLMPMPDGSVWLAGIALGSPSGQHAAVWRIKADGALDFNFGAAGLWQRPGRDRSRALSLALAPDGSVAVGVEAPEGEQTLREVYLLQPGGKTPQPGESIKADEDDDEEAFLEWSGDGWRWYAGEQIAVISAVRAETAAASAVEPPGQPADAGHGGFSPFGGPASAPPALAGPAEELPWGLILAGAGAVLALLALWWRSWRAERSRAPRR